jgi:hypothetical protein
LINVAIANKACQCGWMKVQRTLQWKR